MGKWYLRSEGYMKPEYDYQEISHLRANRAIERRQSLCFFDSPDESGDSRVYINVKRVDELKVRIAELEAEIIVLTNKLTAAEEMLYCAVDGDEPQWERWRGMHDGLCDEFICKRGRIAELEAENAELRDFVHLMGQRVRENDDIHDFKGYVTKLEAENAELRKFARDMYASFDCGAGCVHFDRDGCRAMVNNGPCMMYDRMAALGIEVDA